MTIGDIIEALQDMDPEENAAFHLLTHDQLHLAAEAAGIEIDCEHIDRALGVYQTMLDHHIGSDPYRMFKAISRAAEGEGTERAADAQQPIFH